MNFRNMSIRKSLIIGFGTTILVSVAIIIASLIMMNMQKSAYSDIIDKYVGANELTSECRIDYNIAARSLRDAVLSGDLSNLDTATSKIDQLSDALKRLNDSYPLSDKTELNNFVNTVEEWEVEANKICNTARTDREAAVPMITNSCSPKLVAAASAGDALASKLQTEQDKIIAMGKKYAPGWLKRYLLLLKQDAKRLIGGYFLAQFRIMFVVAAVLAVGFLILGVHYGLLFAVLIAFLDFLPMFGTGTALGPWALIKLFSGEYAFAAGLILLYVLTQVVRQVIQPKIVGDAMGLPPLATLFLLYLGFKLEGIAGMILAVPVGLLFFSLYQHGAFEGILENIRLLAEEIRRFRLGE